MKMVSYVKHVGYISHNDAAWMNTIRVTRVLLSNRRRGGLVVGLCNQFYYCVFSSTQNLWQLYQTMI